MSEIRVVEESNREYFAQCCNDLLKKGYRLHSSSCGFIQAVEYDFASLYQAVFILEDKHED